MFNWFLNLINEHRAKPLGS